MLVDDYLAGSAAHRPDKVALVCGSQRLSYGQVARAAAALATAFRRLGVRRGDRVVIHLENGVEAVLAMFATLKAGGVIVVVNPTTKIDKLRYIAADCGATLLVTEARSGVVDGLRDVVSRTVVNGTDGVADSQAVPFTSLLTGPDELPAETRIDLDLAAIAYTSGSTGTPKGVVLSHGNMVAAATSIISYLGTTEDDVILDALPLSFDYGLYQVLMAFAVGARLVLDRSFVYTATLLETLVREGVTGLPIVPTIAALMLRHDLKSYDLRALRYITSTGAAFPPTHIAALRAALPHVRLYSMYGLTESKRVSYLAPEELENRPDSVGKPMPNVEVFVADESGRLHDRGIGELVVRGSNVMQGYWGLPQETDRVLRPGLVPGERVLYTGDTFRIDDDGYLYFIGRTDDIIKCRGEKVSPREIEIVLYELPEVLEAAVVGMPDPVLGSAIKAYVVPQPGAHVTEQEVSRHCARRLEAHLVPQSVEIVSRMPRTSTGKIDRAELRHVAV